MIADHVVPFLEQVPGAGDPPWGLATTAAGVAILLVVIFLRYMTVANDKATAAAESTRKAHTEEMQAQRQLFVGTLQQITETNAASAERVETALRDLASELRTGQPRPRGVPT